MQVNASSPILIPAKAAVLLLFMPTDANQRKLVRQQLPSLNYHLDQSVRLIQVEDDVYPEIVKSFAVTHLPTLVLVRQGAELWRHEGLPDETDLAEAVNQLLLT